MFHPILMPCVAAGLVKLGHVALDGTKIGLEKVEAEWN